VETELTGTRKSLEPGIWQHYSGLCPVAIRYDRNNGFANRLELRDVYREAGSCANPMGNVGQADIIVQGLVTVEDAGGATGGSIRDSPTMGPTITCFISSQRMWVATCPILFPSGMRTLTTSRRFICSSAHTERCKLRRVSFAADFQHGFDDPLGFQWNWLHRRCWIAPAHRIPFATQSIIPQQLWAYIPWCRRFTERFSFLCCRIGRPSSAFLDDWLFRSRNIQQPEYGSAGRQRSAEYVFAAMSPGKKENGPMCFRCWEYAVQHVGVYGRRTAARLHDARDVGAVGIYRCRTKRPAELRGFSGTEHSRQTW